MPRRHQHVAVLVVPAPRNSWPSFCLGLAAFFGLLAAVPPAAAEDWPQWRGANRDGLWRETGIVDQFESEEIAIRWRATVSNGYSGPTVANGRVYVTDFVHRPERQERLLAFDFEDGSFLWSHSWPADYGRISFPNGPRASVTIAGSRAYALGAVGRLVCCDAATGAVLWCRDMAGDFAVHMPTRGLAAAPLVEGDLVIVQVGGTPEACLVALDKVTGEVRWTALEDHASYSAPTIIEQAGRRVLVCWTAARVAGLDPATGELLWDHPFIPHRLIDQIITPVVHEDYLFVSSFSAGSLMLRLLPDRLAVEPVWRRMGANERQTDSLHVLMGNPAFFDGGLFGVDSFGQFRGLDVETGDRLWEDTTVTSQVRWGSAHMVMQGNRAWIFNDTGELIIAHLSREGYEEISRARLIAPTRGQLDRRGGVTWAHPAFSHRHVLVRNDRELVSASLAAPEDTP